MKMNEQPAEWCGAQDSNAALADQFWLESGYLPPQNDQSWREQEAMGFTVSQEDGFSDSPADGADEQPIPQEQVLEPDSRGRGLKGVMFALLMVPVVAFAIAAFTAPGILRADFWRAHWDAASSLVNPAVPPAIAVRTPVPLPVRAPPPPPRPVLATAPDLNTAPAADAPSADATPGPAAIPVPAAAPETNMIPAVMPKPRPQPVLRSAHRDKAGDRDTGGFYAMVIGPDGTREYTYFPSKPSP